MEKIGSKKKNLNLPRLTVFKSNRYIYAQIVDDKLGKTLVSASNKEDKLEGKNIVAAEKVGEAIAKKALNIKIKRVYFDRGRFPYHGRIEAVAEGARKTGLKI